MTSKRAAVRVRNNALFAAWVLLTDRGLVEQAQAARLAAIRLGVVEAAEFQSRAARRFRRRHAGADEIGRVLLDMEAHLLGHGVAKGFAHGHVDELRALGNFGEGVVGAAARDHRRSRRNRDAALILPLPFDGGRAIRHALGLHVGNGRGLR